MHSGVYGHSLRTEMRAQTCKCTLLHSGRGGAIPTIACGLADLCHRPVGQAVHQQADRGALAGAIPLPDNLSAAPTFSLVQGFRIRDTHARTILTRQPRGDLLRATGADLRPGNQGKGADQGLWRQPSDSAYVSHGRITGLASRGLIALTVSPPLAGPRKPCVARYLLNDLFADPSRALH